MIPMALHPPPSQNLFDGFERFGPVRWNNFFYDLAPETTLYECGFLPWWLGGCPASKKTAADVNDGELLRLGIACTLAGTCPLPLPMFRGHRTRPLRETETTASTGPQRSMT